MSTVQKPFARWPDFASCKTEMMSLGHSEQSAGAICGSIQARAEKGELYKTAELPALEILKAEGDELVVGGPASWDLVDPEKDWITTQGQVNFLRKYFQMPPDFQNVSIDHNSLIIGKGLRQYPEQNPRYFSHVHEKGMYFITKIRSDNMPYVQQYRGLIKSGVYKMYSVRGRAVNPTFADKDGERVRKIDDMDPIEIAIVQQGMNQKAGPLQLLKGKCAPCIEHYTQVYVAKGFTPEQARLKAEQLLDRVQERLKQDEGERPPKDWWDACVASVQGGDPAAICGHIFFHTLGGDRSRADPGMFEKANLLETLKMTWQECIDQASANPDVTDPEALCGWLKAHGPSAKGKGTILLETERILNKHLGPFLKKERE